MNPACTHCNPRCHMILRAGLIVSIALASGGCSAVKEMVFRSPEAPQAKALPPSGTPQQTTTTTASSEAQSQDLAIYSPAPTDPVGQMVDRVDRRRVARNDPMVTSAGFGILQSRSSPVPHRTRPDEIAPESPNVSQVTFAHDGAVFDPVVSADGLFVVFASTQHRPTADIYLKQVNSRVVTQLTSDPAHDAMPAISPDGSRIAFTSNRAGSWDIFVMPIAGGRPLQITADPAHEVHPSWSPDGSKIVFSRLGSTSGRWEMWVVDAHNSATSQFIGYGQFPEWCPVAGTGLGGGDRILFQRSRERGSRAYSVWTIDYDNGQASRPTEIASSPTAALINPTWSPDGRRLIYASIPIDGRWDARTARRPSQSDLWMIDIEGTNLVRLTDGHALDLMPAWASPTTVYFASDRGGVDNLWTLDVADAIAIAQGSPSPADTMTRNPVASVPEPID